MLKKDSKGNLAEVIPYEREKIQFIKREQIIFLE